MLLSTRLLLNCDTQERLRPHATRTLRPTLAAKETHARTKTIQHTHTRACFSCDATCTRRSVSDETGT